MASGSFKHTSPEFTIYWNINKTSKVCKIKVVKSNNYRYDYSFKVRVRSNSKTVCEISIPVNTFSTAKTYNWVSGTATGDKAVVQVACGDSNCGDGWSEWTNKKTINFTTVSYSNDSAGDFTFNYNTTTSLRVHVTSATTGHIVTTSGSTTTKSTPEGALFVMTANATSLANKSDPYTDAVYFTECDLSDSDFTIDSNGAWLATLKGLSMAGSNNGGYCFQLWYIDDELDDFKLLQTKWYAISCMPSLSVVAGTSVVNINGSTGAWGHTANVDCLNRIKIAITTSQSMPNFDTQSSVNVYTSWNDYIYNLSPNTLYYIHIIKYGDLGYDIDSHTHVTAYTGNVTLSISHHSSSTNNVKISCDCGGHTYNNDTWNYNAAVSTANTDYHYSFDQVNWNLIGTGQTDGIFYADIPINPGEIKTVYIRYRELNTDKNTTLSQSIQSIKIAGNINVVRVGNNWAIPKVFDGTKWRMAKAKVFDGSVYRDTREAHYDYNTGKYVV